MAIKYNLNPTNICKILSLMECHSIIETNLKKRKIIPKQRHFKSHNFSQYMDERWEDVKWEIENNCYEFFTVN
jgi:hypothetical protein